MIVFLRIAGALGVGAVVLWCAGRPPAATTASQAQPRATDAPTPTYVGAKRCRMCHTDHHDQLQQSHKGGSWDALAPHQATAVKRRAGLDAATDFRTSATCLNCHAVGHGEPGGYAVPPPGDRRAARRAEQLQGVGCESCHGPGSAYVEVMSDILKNKRSYDAHEVRDAGRRVVTRATCLRCHTAGAPCMANAPDSDWLDIDLSDHHGYHDAVPLVYRRPPADPAPPARDAP